MATRPTTCPTVLAGRSARKKVCTTSLLGWLVRTLSIRTANGHASSRPTQTETPIRGVDDAVFHLERADRVRHFRETRGELVSVSRDQVNAVPVLDRDEANPIKLQLVHPIAFSWRFLHEA